MEQPEVLQQELQESDRKDQRSEKDVIDHDRKALEKVPD